MDVLTIVGARPQFVKAAPVSLALRESEINEIILHTGQHYNNELSELFFNQLNLEKPKYNLNCGSGSHANLFDYF